MMHAFPASIASYAEQEQTKQASAQTTGHVLMIRPARFVSNPETSGSNAFQHDELDMNRAQSAALGEFDAYVAALRAAGIDVTVINDMPEPHTPDSIFPNNWVSFHADGRVLLYPMEAHNRRLERKPAILQEINKRFFIRELIDMGHFEHDARFLEGTGSMVLDHDNRLAYVCRSSRSHPDIVNIFSDHSGYRPVMFDAVDRYGQAIYHTNVMMCIGRTLAIVCMEAIPNRLERALLERSLQATGKELIDISYRQMKSFAGNMLELRGKDDNPVFAMSRNAWAALTEKQRQCISEYATPVLAPIDTIERLGGGSARCMLAEIFLPLRWTEGVKNFV